MSDFNYNKKESYTQQDLETILDQHYNFTKNKVSSDLETKIKDLETKNNELLNSSKSNENNIFLNSVPKNNQKIVSELLKIKSIEEIKNDFSNLLEPPKGLDNLLNGVEENEKRLNDRINELDSKLNSGKITDEEMNEYMKLTYK